MDNMKLVSIAMATYNGEKYIREQLDSIVAQTYRPIEVIVCDDASLDNTIEIINEYCFKLDIKITKNEKNLGYAKNFEKAILKCSGDYIALCDQDDIWKNNKIERLMNEISGYSLIYSDASLINQVGDLICDSKHKAFMIDEYSDMLENKFIFRNYVVGCTCLFKRKLILELNIPDEIPHDWWIAILAIKNKGIKYLDHSLVLYRQHDSNQIGFKQTSISEKISQCFDVENFNSARILCEVGVLSKSSQKIFNEFYRYNDVNLIKKIRLLFKYRKILYTKRIMGYLLSNLKQKLRRNNY